MEAMGRSILNMVLHAKYFRSELLLKLFLQTVGHEGKVTVHFISHQATRKTWFIWTYLWQWDTGSPGTNP
jgi:hypothetical protein